MTKLILHHLKYRIYIRTKKDDQIHSINKENDLVCIMAHDKIPLLLFKLKLLKFISF